MPAAVTIFAVNDLILIEGVLVAALVTFSLSRRPRPAIYWWAIATILTALLSCLSFVIAQAVYADPRPFTVDHVQPLVSQAADNGFPSHHALAAAILTASVAIISFRLAIPVAALACLVDWAHVAAGLHHVADVAGSSLIVVFAMLVALLVTPAIVQSLAPYVPQCWYRILPAEDERDAADMGTRL